MLSWKCPPNKQTKGKMAMNDFLKFKKMITPVIIQILFWIGVVGSVILGLILIIVGGANARWGLMWILLGPIVTRVYCELLIVIFSINDTLTEVKNVLKNKTTT